MAPKIKATPAKEQTAADLKATKAPEGAVIHANVEIMPDPGKAITLKTPDTGLTAPQLAQAKMLQEKCAPVVQAVLEANQLEAQLGDKYFAICRALRQKYKVVVNADERTLDRKEVSLLLQSLGYRKQRITEINKVVEVTDEIWKSYEARKLSFRGTLQLARGAGEEGSGEGEVDSPEGAGTGADAGKPQPKTPKAVQSELAELLVKHFDSLKSTKGKKPYVFTYETPNGDGNEEKKFEVTLKVTVQ